ncbi:MAG: hypothetical protein HY293_05450 [Planctomycetes bacterium]|nr:hypothetical protein [Planctomycetota bacterium]
MSTAGAACGPPIWASRTQVVPVDSAEPVELGVGLGGLGGGGIAHAADVGDRAGQQLGVRGGEAVQVPGAGGDAEAVDPARIDRVGLDRPGNEGLHRFVVLVGPADLLRFHADDDVVVADLQLLEHLLGLADERARVAVGAVEGDQEADRRPGAPLRGRLVDVGEGLAAVGLLRRAGELTPENAG